MMGTEILFDNLQAAGKYGMKMITHSPHMLTLNLTTLSCINTCWWYLNHGTYPSLQTTQAHV